MAKASRPRQEIDAALRERFVPLLRELGFKGSYPHFRRVAQGRVELVGVQFSQWGRDFYVELSIGNAGGVTVGGRHIDANQLKHYHGWPRVRLGELPFDYGSEAIDKVVERVIRLVPRIDDWFAHNAADGLM